MGKPWKMATDGPDTFSCAGLIRYIMRTIGVDGNAPWVPEGYLSAYAHVDPANLQPGDVVIFPDWATMYAGNGMVLNSNEDLGYVTLTPMSEAGTPEGIVRPPYADAGQPSQGGTTQPLDGTSPTPQQTTLSDGSTPVDGGTSPTPQQTTLNDGTTPTTLNDGTTPTTLDSGGSSM